MEKFNFMKYSEKKTNEEIERELFLIDENKNIM